jgi:hypothetical protein
MVEAPHASPSAPLPTGVALALGEGVGFPAWGPEGVSLPHATSKTDTTRNKGTRLDKSAIGKEPL